MNSTRQCYLLHILGGKWEGGKYKDFKGAVPTTPLEAEKKRERGKGKKREKRKKKKIDNSAQSHTVFSFHNCLLLAPWQPGENPNAIIV